MQKYEIQKLRDLPIERVAEQMGIKVERHKALCPFHDDHHASLSFNTRKNSCRCYVCMGNSVGTIDLVMKYLGKDFLSACRWLAEVNGVYLEDGRKREGSASSLSSEASSAGGSHSGKDSGGSHSGKSPSFDASRYARFFEHPWLNEAARRFLFEERKIDWRVVNWCRLTSWTDKKGINWLQIPYFDMDGRLIGIQNRNLDYRKTPTEAKGVAAEKTPTDFTDDTDSPSHQTEGSLQTKGSHQTEGSLQTEGSHQTEGSLRAEGSLQTEGSLRTESSLQPEDSHQTEGSHQAEGSHQSEGSLQTEGSHQTEGSLRTEGSHQTEDSHQTKGSHQTEGSLRTEGSHQTEGSLRTEPMAPRFRFPYGARCSIYNLPVVKMLKPGERLFITEGCSDCWAMLSAGHKAIAIPSATLLKPEDKQLLADIERQYQVEFHMFPDQDAPGESLFLQLREILPHLVHHQLPPGCKDFIEYYLESFCPY